MAEREHWKDYQKAFEDALTATSTKRAPWYVIPADRKYVARAIVADVITTAIQDLDLKYPEVTGREDGPHHRGPRETRRNNDAD